MYMFALKNCFHQRERVKFIIVNKFYSIQAPFKVLTPDVAYYKKSWGEFQLAEGMVEACKKSKKLKFDLSRLPHGQDREQIYKAFQAMLVFN